MNEDRAIEYWETETHLYAEWADRSLDDEDRALDDTVKLRASVEKNPDWSDHFARNQLRKALQREFDRWVDETGRS